MFDGTGNNGRVSTGETNIHWARPTVGSPLLRRVQSLGDSFASTVGHLPFAAWDDYAAAGHILAAIDDDSDEDVLGYVTYRLPRDEVVIAQLVVNPKRRGNGIARALVQEISAQYHERRGIRLRCRRDFAVNSMWPHLGFVSRGERSGRSHSGSILTEWWRDHGHIDLMSWQGSPPQVIPVLIDSNVFFDLHPEDNGPCRPEIQFLKDLDGNRLDIIVSPETLNEIQRNPVQQKRTRLLSLANSYPRLAVNPALREQWEQRIRSLVDKQLNREQDTSDLRHVAYAVSAGIEVLVTQDRPARKRYERIAEGLGLQVTSIDEIIPLIDAQENQPAYTPQALLGTGFQLREMTAKHRLHVQHLLATSSGERRVDYDAIFDRLARERPRSTRSMLVDPEGTTVAVVGAVPSRGVLEVLLLRVQTSTLEGTIAAQLVNQLREVAASTKLAVIRVNDPHCGPALVQALQDDGFMPTNDDWIGISLRRSLSWADAASELNDLALRVGAPTWLMEPAKGPQAPSAEQAHALEHRFRPLRILDGDLPTFIVPIQHRHSSDLFGHPSNLFTRPDHLGMSLEQVYYRAGTSSERSPARVLWYLSGFSEVFACSTLVGVVDADPKTLYKRFRRLGVYSYADVAAAAAKTGTARALHVIDTHMFRRPIDGHTLRSCYRRHRQSFSVQWPTILQPALAAELLTRGYEHEP